MEIDFSTKSCRVVIFFPNVKKSKCYSSMLNWMSSADGHTDMPMLWIFPYFFEPRILGCLPSFTMLDYQVIPTTASIVTTVIVVQ